MATPALADPCKAIPDHGPMPAGLHRGAVFSGLVRYVGDGDGLCVGESPDPLTWIEVRLADFYAPELHAPGGAQAKAALERVTRKAGRPGPGAWIACTADHRSWDRIVARCQIDGISIGDLMRRAGVAEGGNAHLSEPSR